MKSLAYLTSFYNLNASLDIKKDFFEHISKNFKETYIVNIDELNFLPYFSKLSFGEMKRKEKVLYKLPKNIKLINPKNSKAFIEFTKKKDLLIINTFGKSFFTLKIHFLIKKIGLKQIIIDNLGTTGMSAHIEPTKTLRYLNYHIFQNLFKKIITPSLMIFGLISRIDLYFTSKRKELENAKKSWIRGFLLRKKLLFSKEYKLINSRSYDFLLTNKIKIEEKYIIHLDAEMNGRHEIETRGRLNEKDLQSHYYYLRLFLSKLSKDFNKPVIVCMHPSIKKRDIDKFVKSKLLKGFKITQNKSRYFIYKSFLVTSFDTSAIVDAAILKKKIIGLWSRYMDINQIEHSKTYPNQIGYQRINLENFNYDKKKLIKSLNKDTSKYGRFIRNYHCHKKNIKGVDEMISIIKKKYKCV
tara:strand:+ start:71 stop:1306 length:1236 start_codon:yes stop_codon:yes gene_type:complete